MKKEDRICTYRGPGRYGGDVAAYLTVHYSEKIGDDCLGLVVAPHGEEFQGKNYFELLKLGADRLVCGTCNLKSRAAGGNQSCFVGSGSRVGLGLQWLQTAHLLEHTDPEDLRRAFRRYPIFRSAVWGDAAALPQEVWVALEDQVRRHNGKILGYTHGWEGTPWLRPTHQASVESLERALLARAMGWHPFRSVEPGEKPTTLEFYCPATPERDHATQCCRCLACTEEGRQRTQRSPIIWEHSMKGKAKTKRILNEKAPRSEPLVHDRGGVPPPPVLNQRRPSKAAPSSVFDEA